jgi:hypothetical protein
MYTVFRSKTMFWLEAPPIYDQHRRFRKRCPSIYDVFRSTIMFWLEASSNL